MSPIAGRLTKKAARRLGGGLQITRYPLKTIESSLGLRAVKLLKGKV